MAQNVDCDLLVRQFSEVPKASMRVQVWAPRNNFMHACTIHKENREKSMLRVSTVCTVPCVVCCAVYKHLGPLLHCAGQVARPDCLQCHLMVVCFDGTFSLLLLINSSVKSFWADAPHKNRTRASHLAVLRYENHPCLHPWFFFS